eukprot:Skav225783  [mRNA]  locus=scaffold2147:12137:16420:- [translate_table: standard]
MDRALRTQHEARPLPGAPAHLGSKYRGRCQMKMQEVDLQKRCIPSDRFGGYEPPVEAFSAISQAKTRQTRRLKSFEKAMQSFSRHFEEYDDQQIAARQRQLTSEWQKILQSKGYGRSWCHWILSFQCINTVPTSLPSHDQLSDFIQITEHDANATCVQEACNRRASFRFAIQTDMDQAFGSLTYKYVKNPQQMMLTEVPVIIETHATLMRSRKGQTFVKMAPIRTFEIGAQVTFGEATCVIRSLHHDVVGIHAIHGTCPSQGTLRQTKIATSPDAINEAFKKFWEPMWLRDTIEEQEEDAPWESFIQDLDHIDFSGFEASVDLQSIEQWELAVASLKDNKSPGRDAWRNQELKMLRREAIGHLKDIILKILPWGFHHDMMVAKTSLLAKIPQPRSMDHGRPITILATLYRLVSRVIYQQIIRCWAAMFPAAVSGGLPHRGVRDISIAQATEIEHSLLHGHEICGATMDLTKAFNLVPRKPLQHLLSRLGVGVQVIRFWFANLAKLTRSLLFAGVQCSPVGSTCGFPEGDSLSILAMLAVSFVFYHKVKTASLKPFAYADNWSWLSRSTKDQFRAWVHVLNLLASLRMKLSISKSWLWGSTAAVRKEISATNVLFEQTGEAILVKTFAKDLGEIMQYNRQQIAAPLLSKFDQAFAKLTRVSMMPINIDQKCRIIQGSIWPAVLYGVDLHYLGKTHFNQLRRGACDAILGYRKQANPFLAMILLSRHIMDPLLFVITSACRAVRRLYSLDQALATSLTSVAASYVGKTTYGPATSLARYLDLVGLEVDTEGWIWHRGFKRFNILTDSTKRIAVSLRHHWYQHVLRHEVDRRGIDPKLEYNVPLTQKAFAELTNREQKLIMLNLVGGFQSNATKASWATDHEEKCELCGQVDHIAHRFKTCSALQHVRDRHPNAVQTLHEHAVDWVYHPIARYHDNQETLHLMLEHFVQPQMPEAVPMNSQVVTFFTDGGCLHPRDSRNRVCSWAVIRDCATSQELAIQQTQTCCKQNLPYPWWRCEGLGLVPGRQTIDRAELFAVIYALESALQCHDVQCIHVYTDSAYVIHVCHLLPTVELEAISHVMANPDLLRRIRPLLLQVTVVFHKVRSHQDPQHTESALEAWTFLGNNAVDALCTKTLQTLPHTIAGEINQCRTWNEQEELRIKEVMRFFVDNNLTRHELLQQYEASQRTDTERADVCPFQSFSEYTCDRTITMLSDILDDRIFTASLQGKQLGYQLFHWWKQIQWPVVDEDEDNNADWRKDAGISWLELTINFFVCTGRHFPVRISAGDEPSRNAGSSVFLDYSSTEAKMQPHSSRAAAKQVIACQNAIQGLSAISPTAWIPPHVKTGGCSLRKMGYKQNLKGLTPRPILPYAADTMTQVRIYLESLNGGNTLSKPLDGLQMSHYVEDFDVAEPTSHVRYKEYLKIKNYGLR